jgi:hypothetical protein
MRGTIGIMTLFALTAQAAESRSKAPQHTVTVCMDSAADVRTEGAEAVASAIFSGIAIKLDWRHGSHCPANTLTIRLTVNTPRNVMAGSFAFAQPYQGSNIQVFYDRVSGNQLYAESAVPKVLGHVLAHEIGHILQGTDHHSDTGVMKAHWTAADFKSIAFRPLRFTEEDVSLIQAGLAHSPRN